MTKSVTDEKFTILIALLLRDVNTIRTKSKAWAVCSARNRRNAEFCNQKEELNGTRMCTVRVGRSTASNRWRWRMKPFPSDLIGFRVWSSIIQFALDARWAIVYDTKREGTKGAGAHVFFNERAPSASYSRIDVPCQTWSRSIFWNHAYTVASQRLPMKTREEKGIFASWNAFFYPFAFFRGKGEIDETHFFGVHRRFLGPMISFFLACSISCWLFAHKKRSHPRSVYVCLERSTRFDSVGIFRSLEYEWQLKWLSL